MSTKSPERVLASALDTLERIMTTCFVRAHAANDEQRVLKFRIAAAVAWAVREDRRRWLGGSPRDLRRG
jgi:hypothetical protein